MSQYVLLIFDNEQENFNGETDQAAFLRRFENYRALRDQVGSNCAVELFLTDEEEATLRERRKQL